MLQKRYLLTCAHLFVIAVTLHLLMSHLKLFRSGTFGSLLLWSVVSVRSLVILRERMLSARAIIDLLNLLINSKIAVSSICLLLHMRVIHLCWTVLKVLSTNIHLLLVFGKTCDIGVSEALKSAPELIYGCLQALLMHSASVRADLHVLLHIPFRASFRPLSETLHTLLGNITNPNLPIKLTYPIMKTNRLQFSISLIVHLGIRLFMHGI